MGLQLEKVNHSIIVTNKDLLWQMEMKNIHFKIDKVLPGNKNVLIS